MADPLFVSFWLKAYSSLLQPSYWKKALSEFPLSRLDPSAVLRVHAISFQEAPLIEEPFDDASDIQPLLDSARHFLNDDIAVQIDLKWDLWQWDGDWSLAPSRATFEIYAPAFDSPQGEHIRFEAGPESLYLPLDEQPGARRQVQSNVRSLLHLVADLEAVLAVERRVMWSDSGENFAERFALALR